MWETRKLLTCSLMIARWLKQRRVGGWIDGGVFFRSRAVTNKKCFIPWLFLTIFRWFVINCIVTDIAPHIILPCESVIKDPIPFWSHSESELGQKRLMMFPPTSGNIRFVTGDLTIRITSLPSPSRVIKVLELILNPLISWNTKKPQLWTRQIKRFDCIALPF